VPVTVPGKLFNLQPQPGEPARFGIVLHPPGGILPPIILQSAVQLRPTDLGLDTVINNIPNTTVVSGDTTINSQDITLFATAPGTGQPFMRNPTYCTPATTNFSAIPYTGSPGTGQASFTATGCAALPFDPKFSAEIGPLDPGANSTKAPVTTTISQGATEAGLKNAQVFLPQGLGPDLALLNNNCTPADFATSSCPDSTKVGQAVATSPILSQPLTGPLVLVSNGSGVPDLGLDLKGQLAIQLKGTFLTTPTNGVQFAGLPDIPISTFKLTFAGGPGGLLIANRTLCDPPTPPFNTSFDSYSGVNRAGPATPTITGCGSGPPTAKLKLKKPNSKHPRMKLAITAGGSSLRGIKLKLPKQLRFSKKGTKAKPIDATLPKNSLKTKKRKLTVAETEGSGSLTIDTGKSGLTRHGKLRKPKFKLSLTDASGNVTPLTLKPGK
jgi:hypothetical protein